LQPGRDFAGVLLAVSAAAFTPRANAVDIDNHWRGHYAYIHWNWSETKNLARGYTPGLPWYLPYSSGMETMIVHAGVQAWAAYAWYKGRCLGATVTYSGWPPNGWFWTYNC
jgi:hypothetical protein